MPVFGLNCMIIHVRFGGLERHISNFGRISKSFKDEIRSDEIVISNSSERRNVSNTSSCFIHGSKSKEGWPIHVWNKCLWFVIKVNHEMLMNIILVVLVLNIMSFKFLSNLKFLICQRLYINEVSCDIGVSRYDNQQRRESSEHIYTLKHLSVNNSFLCLKAVSDWSRYFQDECFWHCCWWVSSGTTSSVIFLTHACGILSERCEFIK